VNLTSFQILFATKVIRIINIWILSGNSIEQKNEFVMQTEYFG